MGCIYAMIESEGGDSLCPFCRIPCAESDEEIVKRIEKLMEKGNPSAYNNFAGFYAEGSMGMPHDWFKANELCLKAGELGCAEAYFNLGGSYAQGWGVGIDMKKAKYYCELAAMMGNVKARYNLGCIEEEAGNQERAHKHFMIRSS